MGVYSFENYKKGRCDIYEEKEEIPCSVPIKYVVFYRIFAFFIVNF
jgi:hypothetical protein